MSTTFDFITPTTSVAVEAPHSTTQPSLRDMVRLTAKKYLAQLEGYPQADVYNLFLAEIELPLIEAVMQYTRGNQSMAAKVLGLSRGTLRKKLKIYDMLD